MKRKLGAILLTLVLVLTLGLVTAAPVGADPPNLITNGDFEDGNSGFTTEYTYLNPSSTGPWTLGPEYMYTVSTNPNLYHSAWTSFGDHTTGDGKMMIVNGSWEDTSPGYDAVVWAQGVELPVCDTVQSSILYAGQTWEIGEVLVNNDVAGKICVKFVLTDQDAIDEGWLITEAHVAVGAEPENIPQTKKGNPIPGKFPVNVSIDPGVTETDWFCLDYIWVEGTNLVIAAHANIELPELGHEETGWGNGPGFDGRNWATYIEYDPIVCSTEYLLEFWAGNSYPGSRQWPAQPAILQVEINDTVVGTLDLDYSPPFAPTPGWKQFIYTWDAGSETSANIEIRDTRHIMYGDDFVLDDISLVQQ